MTDAKAQRLLQKIDVWLERSSLERLRKIGRYPSLAKHVKELRFHSERLDDISPEAHHKSYWLTNHGNIPCGILNDLHDLNDLSFSMDRELTLKQPPKDCSAEECFAKYSRQLEDQKRMEKQGEDFLVLKTTFPRLLNLSHISIDNMNRLRVLDDFDNAYDHGTIRKPVENSGSHLMELILRVTSIFTTNLTSFEVLHDARHWGYGCGANNMNFPALFRKLHPHRISSAVRNLRSLKLKNVYYENDEIVHHDSVREESCFYRWTCKASEGAEHGTTKAIAEMLNSAPSLEELTLTFYRGYRGYNEPLLTPYIPLQSMRGSNELQQLKRLSLAQFKTRQDQLVQFFFGVASTVTHIDIDGIVLESGSWKSFFLKLQGKFPQLVSFRVGLDNLCEASLGAKDKGTENPESIVKARDFRVSISYSKIHHSRLMDFGDNVILEWLRDGTGSDVLLPALQKSGSSDDSCE